MNRLFVIAALLAVACSYGHDHSAVVTAPDSAAEVAHPYIDGHTDHPAARGNLARLFNDSNHVHLASAVELGIEPLGDTPSFWNITRPLEQLHSGRHYEVDRLTHSYPYLVPEAARMVDEVGARFADTVRSRGLGEVRPIVTSVLRTSESVSRLKRVNTNAATTSAHTFGTTVDISYADFARDDLHSLTASDEALKQALADVLLAMRREGKLWVKYEIRQPCFHITARR